MGVVVGWRVRLVCALLVGLAVVYLGGLTLERAEMWLDPYGPLLKTLPLVAAALIVMALEGRR